MKDIVEEEKKRLGVEEEEMERWMYLQDLAERIEAQNS